MTERRRGPWLILALPLLLVAANVSKAGGDTPNESIVARAYVPSARRPAGEVRLIRRADRSVVEVLLYSKVLSRVVARIRAKELRNWPEGSPGHEDAARYIETIESTQQVLWQHIRKNDISADRRQKMWIDFEFSDDEAMVSVGRFEMAAEPGEVLVSSRETWHQIPISRAYARRNMELIAADAFELEGSDLDRLLQRLPEWADPVRQGAAQNADAAAQAPLP